MKYLACASVFAALFLLPGCAPSREDLRNDAVTKFELGRNEEARASLSRLLHHYPGDAEGFYWMGRVDQAEGSYVSAMFNYRQSLDANPSFDPAREWMDKAKAQTTVSRTAQFDFVGP